MTKELRKKTEKLIRTPFQPRTNAPKLISLGMIEGLVKISFWGRTDAASIQSSG
ncbi:hypothetical protein D3C83_241200 [compost metagenome]